MFSEHATVDKSRNVSTPALHLTLLGSFGVVYNHQVVQFPRRKVTALLAFLVLNRRAHTRDTLAALFWGDTPDEKARHSLRTALATLRGHISHDLLLADRDSVQINPSFPIQSDLHELLTLGKSEEFALPNPAQLALWLDRWQIELLPGVDDDWVLEAREHYRTRLLTILVQLAQRLRGKSEYSQAIDVARKILSFDPAHEPAHQHLMFCFMAAGDRAAALRQYELCEEAMERDLDASPLPETTALYHWIKRSGGEQTSSAARITNLPIPFTSFIGRTQETAEIKTHLAPLPQAESSTIRSQHSTRLLTLIGAGGSGKTRLAIQSATDMIDRFADGVWWVDFSTLTDDALVMNAVAKTIGVLETSSKPLAESLIDALRDKQMLLVLDNCEHLIDAAAKLVDQVLNQCAQLRILTTSREALNLTGERLWHVPPFSLPDPQQLTIVALLMKYECIRLFVERATAIQPDFRLTPENSQFVVEICTQLDGIPLAIELAAGRSKVLAVQEIAKRLKSAIGARFALLTQGSHTAQPRQQTLRAAIDWSYDLLDDAERRLFRQLAWFRGGFTLDALEHVVTFDEGPRSKDEAMSSSTHYPPSTIYRQTSTVLDLLTQLVDKSLVIVELQGEQNRYRLLETLREYALEQWATTSESKTIQRRHAEYFLRWAKEAEPMLIGAHQQTWLTHIEREHPNLRVALSHLLADADGENALQMATALHRFWESRGYISEGRDWLQQALLLRKKATIEVQAKALNALGWFVWRQGEFTQARPIFEEGLKLFEQAEAKMGIADVLQNLAAVEMYQGEHRTAQLHLEQSLQICREFGYEYGAARTLNFLGNLAWDQDKIADAHQYYVESLRVHQRVGDQASIATGFLNVGSIELTMGNVVTATTNYEACLTISRTLGHKGLIGLSLKGMGWAAFEQQHFVQASVYAREALQIFRDLGDKSNIGQVLGALGDAEHRLGNHQSALSCYCENLKLVCEMNHPRAIIFALYDIACLLTETAKHQEIAVRLLAVAHHRRQEAKLTDDSELQKYERQVAGLRQQLGEVVFDRLWEVGQTTALEQIVLKAQMLLLT